MADRQTSLQMYKMCPYTRSSLILRGWVRIGLDVFPIYFNTKQAIVLKRGISEYKNCDMAQRAGQPDME